MYILFYFIYHSFHTTVCIEHHPRRMTLYRQFLWSLENRMIIRLHVWQIVPFLFLNTDLDAATNTQKSWHEVERDNIMNFSNCWNLWKCLPERDDKALAMVSINLTLFPGWMKKYHPWNKMFTQQDLTHLRSLSVLYHFPYKQNWLT